MAFENRGREVNWGEVLTRRVRAGIRGKLEENRRGHRKGGGKASGGRQLVSRKKPTE